VIYCNLYDLIARESASDGIPREKLLSLALRAIADNKLEAHFPDNVLLDEPLLNGVTWRRLLYEGAAAIERNPTYYAGWFRSITVEIANFRKWFRKNWDGRLPPMRGRKPSKFETVKAAMIGDIRGGRLTRDGLADMLQKTMKERYGAARSTCEKARSDVLREWSQTPKA
jgi:hypothetical protein